LASNIAGFIDAYSQSIFLGLIFNNLIAFGLADNLCQSILSLFAFNISIVYGFADKTSQFIFSESGKSSNWSLFRLFSNFIFSLISSITFELGFSDKCSQSIFLGFAF
jgi:hypothetical protein